MKNPGRHFLKQKWRDVASVYEQLVWALGLGGHAPDDEWHLFQDALTQYLAWTDLLAASSLRKRATGRHTEIPELSVARITLADIASLNPWYMEHRRVMSPLIQARAEWWRITEQEYLWHKAHTIQQLLKEPKNREAFTPLNRLEMRRRTTHGEIASLSEQVQLTHREISDAFPFAEYHTRDDRRVRPTHAAMQHFVAARSWHGWPICVPPTSWNCRCFLIFIARFEARERGWLDGQDRPKFELRWPNSLAEENWNAGRFPEWKMKRYWAFPGGSGLGVAA